MQCELSAASETSPLAASTPLINILLMLDPVTQQSSLLRWPLSNRSSIASSRCTSSNSPASLSASAVPELCSAMVSLPRAYKLFGFVWVFFLVNICSED